VAVRVAVDLALVELLVVLVQVGKVMQALRVLLERTIEQEAAVAVQVQ
jgi:hypothetical protein